MTGAGAGAYNARHMSAFRDQFTGPILAAGLVFWIAGLILSAAGAAMVRIALKSMGYPPKKELLYWVSVTAVLFLAFLSAGWLSQREKQSHVASFEPSLLYINTGEGTREGRRVPIALAIVNVTNTGEPSVIREVRLTGKAPNGNTIQGEPLLLLPKIEVTYLDGSRETVWGQDALFVKGQAHPIQRGDSVCGWVLFDFPGVSRDALKVIGTIYTLTVRDVWHRPYTSRLTYTGETPVILNYPGMRPRTIVPAKPPVAAGSH